MTRPTQRAIRDWWAARWGKTLPNALTQVDWDALDAAIRADERERLCQHLDAMCAAEMELVYEDMENTSAGALAEAARRLRELGPEPTNPEK